MSFREKVIKKGYNLISISILVLVFAIISKGIIPLIHRVIIMEKEKELKFQLKEFSRAIFLYKEEKKRFPLSIKSMINAKLLRRIPENPFLKKDGFRFERDNNNRIIKVYPSKNLKKYKKWNYSVSIQNGILKYKFIN